MPIIQYLFLKCSGISQNKGIPNTNATTLALIEAFDTVDGLAYCDLQAMTAFVSAAVRGRIAYPIKFSFYFSIGILPLGKL